MKRLLFLFVIVSFTVSCEKWDNSFASKASDKLIHPDIDLHSSSWIKLDSLTNSSPSDLSFCNENIGAISGFDGVLYLTNNGGKTWKIINTNAHMTFLSIFTLDENTYFTARYGLYKSIDKGATWKACKLSTEIAVFEIWFKDSKIGFLSSGAGTYRSTDAGESWSKISDVIARNLQFTSDDIGYFTYGVSPETKSLNYDPLSGNGDIYRTIDGGKTWKAMGLNVAVIQSLSFISDKIGFFATNDRSLFKTTDGGESCTLIGKKEFYPYDLFFVNENQGLACTGTGISITLDGGYTFNSEYLKQGNGLIYDFEFPTPTTGYAIGNGGLIIKRIP